MMATEPNSLYKCCVPQDEQVREEKKPIYCPNKMNSQKYEHISNATI